MYEFLKYRCNNCGNHFVRVGYTRFTKTLHAKVFHVYVKKSALKELHESFSFAATYFVLSNFSGLDYNYANHFSY